MTVLFTHSCPACGRRQRMSVEKMGVPVPCRQCQHVAVAADPHIESLAMLDSIKVHAELMPLDEFPEERIRAPR